MATPSFFFSIFKRLQVCDTEIADNVGGGSGHFAAADMSGGFSLKYPSHPNGIFGTILNTNAAFGLTGGKAPLSGGNTPEDTPLYVMLSTCESMIPDTNQAGVAVPPSDLQWPPMPNFCIVTGPSQNLAWQQFAVDLVPAIYNWIKEGKVNDEPKSPSNLFYPTLTQLTPNQFPGLPTNTAILFMCNIIGDDGRRPGDQGNPPAPPIPPNSWGETPIILTDASGNELPTSANLLVSVSDYEYYAVGVIGNCGNVNAGRLPMGGLTINVLGFAMVFNTGYSPAVPLPSLSDLNGSVTDTMYEQYFLAQQFYDVVGFRFNVNSVFNQLAQELPNAHVNLGGATPQQWLEGGHASIKMYITSGETPNNFPPNPPTPSIESNPQTDRHVAQKNLGSFVIVENIHQINWTNFVAAQAPVGGNGLNRLQIQHESLPHTFGFLLAMPTQVFEDYVRKAGGIEGFEVVRDPLSRPFPDAVILRETVRGSLLDIGTHEREPFLGMSLGVESDSPRLAAGPLGTVSVVHFIEDRQVFGGFTLEVTMGGARQQAAPSA